MPYLPINGSQNMPVESILFSFNYCLDNGVHFKEQGKKMIYFEEDCDKNSELFANTKGRDGRPKAWDGL